MLGPKIRESAGDFAEAIAGESDERVVAQAAEALVQLVVGLRSRSITLRRVLAEVSRRLARGGGRLSSPPSMR
jgi:phosphoribosyl-ATP pyrophosphohydrolase/phosphoribosyl-AMP cyclohydrolase